MNIKKNLQKHTFLRRIVKNVKIKSEFESDAKNFCNHYIESKLTISHLEYKILLIVHSLEKGMSNRVLRSFGSQKVLELISILKNYQSFSQDNLGTAYKMGLSILQQWKNLYDDNAWQKENIYYQVTDFLEHNMSASLLIDVGVMNYSKSTAEIFKGFNYTEAIKTRHSVRSFSNQKIKDEDIIDCLQASLHTPSACNRQMCKIYQIADKHKKEKLSDVIMGLSGFEKDGVTYFVFTYDISAFSFYGERNQGYFNTGLFAMNFVNALHFKGIGSCFLQWANNSKDDLYIRKVLGIPPNEKIVVILAAGYYQEECIIPKSYRKSVQEIFKVL